MISGQPGNFRCIVCDSENVHKVSGIVNAGISTSSGAAHTTGSIFGILGSGLGGGFTNSSTTNSSVTVSHLAHLLQFEAPPRGCMTSSFRWKRLLRGYNEHWGNLWYCSRCDNVFNALTGSHAPPQSVKQLYQIVPFVQKPIHITQPIQPASGSLQPTNIASSESENQLIRQIRSGQIIREDWFIFLALLVVAPIGIIFVWLNPKWDERTKKIATIAGVIWFIIVCFSGHK